jgi:outer membrane protein assembly factor BamB
MLLAALLAAQFAWIEAAVLAGRRLAEAPGGRLAVALAALVVYGAAVAALASRSRARAGFLRALMVAAALLFTVRFDLPLALSWWFNTRMPAASFSTASQQSPSLVAFLRELAAAQEQYRLLQKSYAPAIDSLLNWVTSPAGSRLSLRRRGDIGWSARVSGDGSTCSVWVRDSTLRGDEWEPEGSPTCGEPERREPTALVLSLLTRPDAHEVVFRESDVGGRWGQHRADERRTGILLRDGVRAYRWTTRIGGELRASVAVAGNQVFIGSHGNGEFVALSLDSGTIGFRIRVPNWVHHEPVVTSDLVIVGFGNNEHSSLGDSVLGSAPSGVAAYDRRTGVERWRRYTTGSVMASPVVRDSLVAVSTSAKQAIAWRLNDGAVAWRAHLPASAPMGNPLLLDTLMVIGLEPTTLCALDVRTGARVYCRTLSTRGWGAGHSSATAGGDLVLQVFDQRISVTTAIREKRWTLLLKKLAGVPEHENAEPERELLGEQVLVALEQSTGRERWRVPLGAGYNRTVGNIAGTPVVVEGVAYVPSPISGHIIAVRLASGRTLWSTNVSTARGSVLVTHGAVLAATTDSGFVVLDAATGRVRCRQGLPGLSDRAGPTLAGETAILALRNGLVLARPLAEWLACRA